MVPSPGSSYSLSPPRCISTSTLSSGKLNAKICFSSHFHFCILLAIFLPAVRGSRNCTICSCGMCDASSSSKLQNLIDMSFLFLVLCVISNIVDGCEKQISSNDGKQALTASCSIALQHKMKNLMKKSAWSWHGIGIRNLQ